MDWKTEKEVNKDQIWFFWRKKIRGRGKKLFLSTPLVSIPTSTDALGTPPRILSSSSSSFFFFLHGEKCGNFLMELRVWSLGFIAKRHFLPKYLVDFLWKLDFCSFIRDIRTDRRDLYLPKALWRNYLFWDEVPFVIVLIIRIGRMSQKSDYCFSLLRWTKNHNHNPVITTTTTELQPKWRLSEKKIWRVKGFGMEGQQRK